MARLRRLLLAAALAAPFVWWLHLALVSPERRMLAPGPGEWIVPADPVLPDPRDGSPARARYVVRFERGADGPASVPVAIEAEGDLRVAVGGVVRFSSARRVEVSERPVRLDLGPWLRPGRNRVVIEVADPRGPGPLRVVAGEGAPATLSTASGAWRASSGGAWAPAVAAGGGERRLTRGPLRWREAGTGLALRLLAVAVAALGLGGLGWAAVRGWPHRHPARRAGGRSDDVAARYGPGAPGPGSGAARNGFASAEPAHREGAATGAASPPSALGAAARRGRWMVFAAFALVAGAQLWNGWDWRVQRSAMDFRGHWSYVRHAAHEPRPPLAEEGWQMYHPPLYYWTAGALYRAAGGDERPQRARRWISRLGGLAGALHALLAWALLARFGPASPLARALALLAVGGAAMSLTTHGMVGNEGFAALIAGAAAVVGAVALARRDPPGPLLGAGLGLLCGLALLAKFTGLMPAAAVGLGLTLRALAPAGRRRALAGLGAFAIAAAAVAAPFYLRNLHVYGEPFLGNWDPRSGYAYEQHPGYRTAGFYLSFGDVLTHPPPRARWSSLWDGWYGSAWGEIHKHVSPQTPRRAAELMLGLYALALLPTIAVVAGLAGGAVRAVRGPRADAEAVLVAVTLFSAVAVAAFTLKLPYHSTVKAFFLLHLTAPATLFAARGLAWMERGLGRARWLLAACVLAQAALTLLLFLRR